MTVRECIIMYMIMRMHGGSVSVFENISIYVIENVLECMGL